MGVGIRGTLGDIDPLNKVPFKRARSRVQKGYPLRGLPNNTTQAQKHDPQAVQRINGSCDLKPQGSKPNPLPESKPA